MLLHIFGVLWAVIALIGLRKIGGHYPDVHALAPAPAPAPDPADSQIALPNCPEKCGDLTIPYPFGIGNECFYNNSNTIIYSVFCNNSANPPRAYIGNKIEVVNITLDGELWIPYPVSYTCYTYDKPHNGQIWEASRNIKFCNEFTFSTTKNLFFAYGCDTSVWFVGNDEDNATLELRSGCATMCDDRQAMYFRRVKHMDNRCFGLGCCTASIPDGMKLKGDTAADAIPDSRVIPTFVIAKILMNVSSTTNRVNSQHIVSTHLEVIFADAQKVTGPTAISAQM